MRSRESGSTCAGQAILPRRIFSWVPKALSSKEGYTERRRCVVEITQKRYAQSIQQASHSREYHMPTNPRAFRGHRTE